MKGKGSSPRVRGLRCGHVCVRSCRRIIPARAGFTGRASSSRSGMPDHPRACGVYPRECQWGRWRPGSSPRVRGLRRRPGLCSTPSRIIPARAGFTRGSRSTLACPADHPRACGVYAWDAKVPGDILGSSPRVRGLPLRRSGRRFAVSDHPRACGVYLLRSCPEGPSPGSSPRVRGLPRRYRP